MKTARHFGLALALAIAVEAHVLAAAELPAGRPTPADSPRVPRLAPPRGAAKGIEAADLPQGAPKPRAKPPEDKPLVVPEPIVDKILEEPTLRAPAEDLTAEAEEEAPIEPSGLAGTLGAASGPQSSAAHMIGDSLGGNTQTITVRIPLVKGFGGARGFRPGDQASSFISGDGYELFLTPGQYSGGADVSGDGYADTWQLTEVIASSGSELLEYGTATRFPLDSSVSTGVLNGGVPGDQAIDGDVTDIPFSEGRLAFDAVAVYDMEVALPPPGMSVHAIKIAENNSVFPQDRFLFNYSLFGNVILSPRDTLDVNRFTFGLEKTWRQGLASLELRVPFASTVNSDQYAGGVSLAHVEFGNIGLIYKRLLHRTDRTAWAAGLALTLPTAEDTRLFLADGTQILQIDNAAVHLMPYVGVFVQPRSRLFAQAFVQVDVATNGNSVYGDSTGASSLPYAGRLHDQTQLFADIEIGYWLYRDGGARRLTGIVPALEVHYTSSLTDADRVEANGVAVTSTDSRYDYLNMTVGGHLLFRDRAAVTPAVVFPLRSGNDRQFDAELQVQVNVWF